MIRNNKGIYIHNVSSIVNERLKLKYLYDNSDVETRDDDPILKLCLVLDDKFVIGTVYNDVVYGEDLHAYIIVQLQQLGVEYKFNNLFDYHIMEGVWNDVNHSTSYDLYIIENDTYRHHRLVYSNDITSITVHGAPFSNSEIEFFKLEIKDRIEWRLLILEGL